MSIQDVIRALNIAKNDLRAIETRFLELKRQAYSLAASNTNAARTFQDFSNQISDMKTTIGNYESLIKEKNLNWIILANKKTDCKHIQPIFEIIVRNIPKLKMLLRKRWK
jgi:hypothetical protein